MSRQLEVNTRLELKVVVDARRLDQLQLWLRLAPAGFRIDHSSRQVNSLYFDSCELGGYAANLSGQSHRAKLRYRWYGAALGPDRGTLELKCKANAQGWKELWPCAHAPYAPGASWSQVGERLAQQLPDPARTLLALAPWPSVLIRYQRNYYVSACGNARLTVDRDIANFGQLSSRTPNLTRVSAAPDIAVLELKLAGSDRNRAEQILRGCPGRISKHSKYATALANLLHR